MMNVLRKYRLKIKQFVVLKKTKGVLIISSLLTLFSYVFPSLFSVPVGTAYGMLSYRSLTMGPKDVLGTRGFPWSFSANFGNFSLGYFILDLVFWFIVVELILTGINLIKDSQK